MKKILKELDKYLVDMGYGNGEEVLSEFEYAELDDSEKNKYVKVEKKHSINAYVKGEEIPQYSEKEIGMIFSIVTSQELRDIKRILNTIKGCVVFFTAITCISMFLYFVISLATAF